MSNNLPPLPEHWATLGFIGTNASFQRAAREQAEIDAMSPIFQSIARDDGLMKAEGEMFAKAMPVMSPLTGKIPSQDNGARLTVGRINELLHPISVSVACLAELGFEPAEQVKASRLYRECDFPAICRAIADHALKAAEQIEA